VCQLSWMLRCCWEQRWNRCARAHRAES
jgi:hypothetical protein